MSAQPGYHQPGRHRGRLREHQAAADHQLHFGRGGAAGEGAAGCREVNAKLIALTMEAEGIPVAPKHA